MENKINLDNDVIVLYALATPVNESIKHMAALNVINEKINIGENQFFTILSETTSQCLLMELSNIYDSASFKTDSNCSIKKLKEVCLNDLKHFPNGQNDDIISEIDNLCNMFEEVVSKHLRNKKLAHYDLKEMFSGKQSCLSASKVQELTEKTAQLLAKVSNRILGAELKLQSINDYMTDYEKSLEDYKQRG